MRHRSVHTVLVLMPLVAMFAHTASAGTLDPPPGPITPTMKTLTEVEPRIAVDTLPGTGNALYSITAPGSYYLTGNITGVAGKVGIQVLTHNAVLDLNGFTMQGVPGSLDGINATGLAQVEVHNGIVQGWGGTGIAAFAANDLAFHDLHLANNGGFGLLTVQATVRNCTATNNALGGINLANGVIEHCVATGNGPQGFGLLNATARYCHATNHDNSFNVIWSEVSHCSAEAGGDQVAYLIRGQCRFTHNTARAGRSVVVEGTGNTIKDCTFDSNTVAIDVTGTANLVVRNTVNKRGGTGFTIAAGNNHGPIVVLSGGGDITGVPGADHPLANIEY